MMLSEISSGEIWMICLTAAMVGIMAIGTFWKKTDVKLPQPLDIQAVESFVSQAEFKHHVDNTTHEIHQIREILRREIPAMERRIAESGEQRVTKLHDRINQVLVEVSRLEGVVEQALKNE